MLPSWAQSRVEAWVGSCGKPSGWDRGAMGSECRAVAASSFGCFGKSVFLTRRGAHAGWEMLYKSECFESRGETRCYSNLVPLSATSLMNTIFGIPHIPSPLSTVFINTLISLRSPAAPASEHRLGAGMGVPCFAPTPGPVSPSLPSPERCRPGSSA